MAVKNETAGKCICNDVSFIAKTTQINIYISPCWLQWLELLNIYCLHEQINFTLWPHKQIYYFK